jgi:hypothetical protein
VRARKISRSFQDSEDRVYALDTDVRKVITKRTCDLPFPDPALATTG